MRRPPPEGMPAPTLCEAQGWGHLQEEGGGVKNHHKHTQLQEFISKLHVHPLKKTDLSCIYCLPVCHMASSGSLSNSLPVLMSHSHE